MKKEQRLYVEGRYFAGHISQQGQFELSDLRVRENRYWSKEIIEKIIEELNEIHDHLAACEVAERLSDDNSNSEVGEDDFGTPDEDWDNFL